MEPSIEQIVEQQIKSWEMEARARRLGPGARPQGPNRLRPFVTISRAFGSGGGEIARRLASNLGYQIFDREIIDLLTREGQLRQAVIASLDEQDRTALETWVDTSLQRAPAEGNEYLRTLIGVVSSIAIHGHAVLVGRGANFILDPERGLNVRIVAPLAQRVETISRLRAIPFDEAESLVHRTDDDRAGFVRQHFGHDPDDPLTFDLLLNTSGIGVEAAVNLIEIGLRKKLGSRREVQF